MVIAHYIPWETTLPPRSTVVPIIGLSHHVELRNFWGDKKAWPVHVTISNILSRRRNGLVKVLILLLVLLLVPPKFTAESARADEG